MTVKKLIDILKECNPNDLVIIASDEEGNSYHELYSVELNSNYQHGEVGYRTLTDKLIAQGYTEDDVIDGTPCVVIYP